ncbi:MAG TPA: sigma-70 family RNA polymerase sigma factor [Pyrinomonadaceae bacterium]|nr:sigma-70 family RNA polymerase sigma factor [Pyrinomonadaceae bacterium]
MFGFSQEKRRLEDWDSFESEALPFHVDLYRLAKWVLRNQTEAEDLVQETFVEALRSFHRFEKGTNCRAWLIKIMYHTLNKRRRDSRRLQVVEDASEQIAETVAVEPPQSGELVEEEVLTALNRLPQHYQEVVILSDVEDMSYKEIAEALSIPTGTVMSRLHRGRSLLRSELGNYARSLGIGVSKETSGSKLRLAETDRGGKSNAV